jgi:hypothetical protein
MGRKTLLWASVLSCQAGLSGFALAQTQWDELDARVAEVTRERTYQTIAGLEDFEQIHDTLEGALSGDPSVVPDLMNLVAHENELVAMTAAQLLGRFPGEPSASLLKETHASDRRMLVRAQALTGLLRMGDSAAPDLVLAALSSDEPGMQGVAIGGLQMLDDSQYSPALLSFLDRQDERAISPEWLEILGSLGDEPGSTAVRDRLLSVASNKDQQFDVRLGAARGLERMGLGEISPVGELLDIALANATSQSLPLVKSRMRRLASEQGVVVNGQTTVEALLRDVELGPHRTDGWGQPFRGRFVAAGVFDVVSDGPDKTRDTADDLSTAEPFAAYVERVFPGVM